MATDLLIFQVFMQCLLLLYYIWSWTDQVQVLW